MTFKEFQCRLKDNMRQGSVFYPSALQVLPTSESPKISMNTFRDGFKKFLLGNGPSVSKTFATILIAPLLIAVYPLSKLSKIARTSIQKQETAPALKIFFGIIAWPVVLVFLIPLGIIAKIARETLRVAITPVAELLLNPVWAAINALVRKNVIIKNESLSFDESINFFINQPSSSSSSAILKVTSETIAPAFWTLGLSLLFRKKDVDSRDASSSRPLCSSFGEWEMEEFTGKEPLRFRTLPLQTTTTTHTVAPGLASYPSYPSYQQPS